METNTNNNGIRICYKEKWRQRKGLLLTRLIIELKNYARFEN